MRTLNQHETVAVVATLIVLSFFLAGPRIFSFLLADSTANKEQALVRSPLENQNILVINDVSVGAGEEAQYGATVSVHYVGTFLNGTKFDSSRGRGQPLVFTLGAGEVISGWDRGIQGMRVGGVRKLAIPPDMAYGATGVKDQTGNFVIPPNAVLLFEVELMGVEK